MNTRNPDTTRPNTNRPKPKHLDAPGRRAVALCAAALAGALVHACASPYAAQRDLEAGRIDEAIETLETLRADSPDHLETRLLLGQAYYQRAREALDAGDEKAYVAAIGASETEFVEAMRVAPEYDTPHLWLGIVLAYKSDMEAAEESFKNALRLEPRQPIHYTNLAQIQIYLGKLGTAGRYLDRGRKRGAPPAAIELNEVLAAWKRNDLVEARDVFNTAYDLDPGFVSTWDEAPVTRPIESFDDFTAYCCANPSCGPYMETACETMQLDVARRELEAETVREQRRQDRERRARQRAIYDKRGRNADLDLRIEEPEPEPETETEPKATDP